MVDQSHPHPLDPIQPDSKHHDRPVRQFEMFPDEAGNACEDCNDHQNRRYTSRLDCSVAAAAAIARDCHVSVTATTWRSSRDVEKKFPIVRPFGCCDATDMERRRRRVDR